MKKLKLNKPIFGLFLVVICLISANNLAAKENHFIIGVEDLEYYPLWRYDKLLKEYKGLGREILDAYAKDRGYSFEYQPYPIKRLVRKLVDKEIDFKFPDNNYWAKQDKGDAKIDYSNPVINYIDGVFVKPENLGKSDESIKTLGSVLGFTPWDWLDKINKGEVKLKETPNFDALINQTLMGRVDGAYINADVVHYHLKVSGREGALVYDSNLSHIKGTYLISTTKHPEMISEFNNWLAENQELIVKLKEKFDVK